MTYNKTNVCAFKYKRISANEIKVIVSSILLINEVYLFKQKSVSEIEIEKK